MDSDGTLYLYRSPLLCVNDIIKRLTEGKYQMAESNMLLGYLKHLIIKHKYKESAFYIEELKESLKVYCVSEFSHNFAQGLNIFCYQTGRASLLSLDIS